jgi:hypothetical protein
VGTIEIASGTDSPTLVTPKMVVAANGNVGIGTTSPGAILDITHPGSNAFALIAGADVFGTARTNATRKFVRIGMPHYTNAEEPVGLLVGDSDGTNNIISMGGYTTAANPATQLRFYTATATTITGGNERMRIAANGNVGIGTTNPAYKLHVSGDIYANGGWLRVSGTSGVYFQTYAGGWKMTDSTWIRNHNSKAIYIQGNGTNAATFMNGNVGIGTTSPTRELAIEKSINTGVGAYIQNVNAGTAASSVLEVRNGSTFTDSVRLLALGTGFTTNNMFIQDAGLLVSEANLSGGLSIAARATNAPIRFYAGSDTVERMRITGNGNVGIGTIAPDYKLHVAGTAGKTTGTSWTNISDSRLKENIQDFSDGLDVLTRIRPVSYELNGLSGTTRGEKGISVIAQEMIELAPYTIGTFAGVDASGQPTEYFDYDASAVTYIIINAVQEQQLQIASNSATVASLEARTGALRFTDDGELVITGDAGEYFVTPTATGSSPIQTIAGFARVISGSLRAGFISTSELVVTQTASISALSVETMTIGGETLRTYIEDVVASLPAPISSTSTETALLSPIMEFESVTAETATISGTLIAETIQTQELNTVDLEATGNTKLSTLLADAASISGELAAEDITTNTLTAETIASQTITTDDFSATTGRLAQLEAGMAQLEEVRAQVAQLSDLTTTNITAVDATISGTLYANSISNLDQHVAAALRQPTLLELLTGQSPTVDPLPALIETVESVGYTATNSASLQQSLADLQLDSEDIVLETTALFVNQYFEVNGIAYVGDQLGVGNSISIGDGLTLSSGMLAYEPLLEDPSTTLFQIQPAGRGTLSFMAGLMTLSETGQVTMTGNLSVAGDIRTEGTLLSNLLKPTDFGSPLQMQVAGAATETGEVTESRFEIINEMSSPVATISAQGRAAFAAGLDVGADDLRAQSSTTSATVTTAKTAGKATIPAGSTELVIFANAIQSESLIYVTPLGSTQNQTLYIKSQQPDNALTPESDAYFVVGFDQVIDQPVEFNWWIVN